jgi:integrase
MDGMPRPRPPHLHRQVSRHGKTLWYVRIGKGPRIRICSAFGTPEFDAEYQAAVAGLPARQTPKDDRTSLGTLAWLIERYRETTAWTDLSLASRRQRENIFEHVLEAAGRQPFAKITTTSIMAGRDRRAKTTPAQARKFLDTMRGLFRWAVKAKLLKVDPTAGVANPSAPNSDGFTPWSIEDITAYEARWPIGTRQRVWFDVLVYTGLRRGDAVRFGRQHIRNGVGTIKTEKTDTVVTLPILPVLMKTLDAGPSGDLTFIAGEGGRPLTKESFGNLFRKACREAGLQNRSAHGLRKAAATRAAENGATVAQLNAIFGWKGAKMATFYTEAADRRRLSIDAMHLLANDK